MIGGTTRLGPRAVGAIGLAVLTVGYVAVLGYFGVVAALAMTPVALAIGISCVLLAAIGVWAVAAEVLFGARAARLVARFEAEAGVPEQAGVGPGGARPDRARAQEAVGAYAALAAAPTADWRDQVRLALVLDAAGRRREARRAMVAGIRAERSASR